LKLLLAISALKKGKKKLRKGIPELKLARFFD
jgi:hypothetical protein